MNFYMSAKTSSLFAGKARDVKLMSICENQALFLIDAFKTDLIFEFSVFQKKLDKKRIYTATYYA